MSNPTPHDSFAQSVFSDPKQAAVIFQSVLPTELLRHVDFAKAELEPSLFTSDELKERRSDFLFKVPLGDDEAYLLALLEHQSSVDSIMAARVLVYVGRAIERYLREDPNAKQIPAVIPVVLYHGKDHWTAATDLFDLYTLPESAKPALRGVVPSLRYLLDDLSRIPDEELRERPGPVLARLALIVMRHAHELRTAPDPRQTMHDIAVSVGDLLQQVLDRTGRTVVFRYMLEIVDLEPKEGEEILVRALPDKVKEDVVTAADQLRAEGRAEGERRGLLEGERRILLRQLRKAFGTIPTDVEQRIASASEAELEAWGGRVRSAATLDDVFATEAE